MTPRTISRAFRARSFHAGGLRARTGAAALTALMAAAPGPAALAQAPDLPGGAVIADRVELDRSGRLVATGGVEVVTPEAHVTAAALAYDRETGVLELTGPVRVETAEGGVLLAEGARLDSALETGVVSGVRVVIDRQLQIAAAELARTGPRFDGMVRAVASSCEVCAANPVPLWEIRAREVIHDREERQIYFSGAQFRVRGVPVAWVPYLRLPGPGNDRSTGLLTPEIVSSSQLGFGIKLPYFVVLGPSRDVTLTPALTANATALGARYRQAFRFGSLSVEGSIAEDAFSGEDLRGHLFAAGRFRLPGGERLEFEIQQASDDTYLIDYDIGYQNLLLNEARLLDVGTRRYAELRATYWDRLRDPVRSETAPDRQAGAVLRRRAPLGGGFLSWGADALSYGRLSGQATDGPDADTIPEGRDGAIAAAHVQWARRVVAGPGLDAAALVRLDAQRFEIRDDATFEEAVSRIVPSAAAELRWPLLRRAGAVTDVIEPVLSLQWSGPAGAVPLEEGTRPELDFGNLYALQRIGGPEGIEEGLRLAAGIGWTRTAPGASLQLALGRLVRREDTGLFAGGGLDGTESDWLAAAQVVIGQSRFDARALFEPDGVSRSEASVAVDRDRWDLSAGYTYQEAVVEIDGIERPRISEMALGAGYAITPNWAADADLTYDFREQRAQRAALSLEWRGQCAKARADVTRRFSSADDLSPETRFGLSVSLTGIAGEDSRSGACGP